MDAYFDVVGFVLVGVDGVVDEGPAEAAEVERGGDGPGDGVGDGGPAEKGAPVEGEAYREGRVR